MEIDNKHKQVLQWAVQAYYEDYLEMNKDKLVELEESLSEMRAILALLGSKGNP